MIRRGGTHTHTQPNGEEKESSGAFDHRNDLIPPTVVVAAIIQHAAITTAGASDGARLQTTDFPLVKKKCVFIDSARTPFSPLSPLLTSLDISWRLSLKDNF
jgi:hypothetical protein